MTPADRVLHEEHEWDLIADELAPKGVLVSVSRLIGDSRVYRSSSWAIKIRRQGAAALTGIPSLEWEASILNRLGRQAQAGITGDWEYLRSPFIAGMELNHVRRSSGTPPYRAILATAAAAYRLHRRGISHGDLRADNVMIDHDGRAEFIDFDRARLMRPGRAMIRDWVGATPFGGGSSLPELALDATVPQVRSIARRARARFRPQMARAHDDPTKTIFDRAWRLAAKSDANAPGHDIAYYAWTYAGTHYTGERPWAFRWELLRNAVSFEGKRVLELGSNMAMTSAYALLHGASSATAVDSDDVILDAAALFGVGLGLPIRTARVSFADGMDWEDALADADLAIAMSILEWLPDRARFERYLGRFPEVVFEGHDHVDIERERLTRIGFRDITLAGYSERGRPMFVARR